ncbi:HD domain-containing protein [bacterium]|nr:HD domain-containing protein [bacterium]
MGTAASRVVVRPAHKLDADDFRRLPLAKLRPGQPLRFPIHSDDGMLLLSEGSPITERILQILEQRGHRSILVHRMEPAAGISVEPLGKLTEVPESRPGNSVGIHNKISRQLDCDLAERIHKYKDRQESPLIKDLPHLGTEPYSEKLAQEIYTKHESFVGGLKDSVQQILQANPEGGAQIEAVLADYLKLLVEDIDLFASFASTPTLTSYPHRHSLHVAMLSLAMGARAGLGEEAMRSLGLGSLLHDVGMLRVPKSIWNSRQPLTAQQQITVMAHPIYTVEMISQVDSIPTEVRYVAYHVHERGNSQGYPRRIPGDLIHPLSRIVSAADQYVALLSERPYRAAVQPYKAVESLVRNVSQGRIDAESVRLLLQTVSLYPVGSYVILSNGQLAKVLRTNSSRYDRPVVRTWPRRTEPTDESGDVINLIDEPTLTVTEAVPSPVVG